MTIMIYLYIYLQHAINIDDTHDENEAYGAEGEIAECAGVWSRRRNSRAPIPKKLYPSMQITLDKSWNDGVSGN